jgi:radical SAM-linked protein
VGVLSLSAGDYGCLNPLLEDFFRRYAPEMVGASLPSLRTETLTPALAEQVKRVRKSGFTIAPEAGSARMRRVINKGNDEEDLLRAVRATFGSGWNLVKLYFMIGLPFERDEDVLAIADLSRKALAEGRKLRSSARITASASTFIPKPHTPFQYAPMIGFEETRRRQGMLARALRGSGVEFKGHDSAQSLVEGILSRADRRIGNVVERVYRDGARLDGWTEHFRVDRWLRAMEAEGLSVAEALGPRAPEEGLPWDPIDCGMSRSWMWEDYRAAEEEVFVWDCALAEKPRCYDCGVCDHKVVKNRIVQAEEYLVQLPGRPADPWRAAGAALPAPAPGDRPRGERVRVHYLKRERAALFGHLDTVRVFERAFRRAGMALVHTQGFNPKPRMVFAPACPLGVESEAEYIDLEIGSPVSAQDVGERLQAQLPQGFEVHCVEALAREAAPISALVLGYVVRFELPAAMPAEEVEARVRAFREAPAATVFRARGNRRKEIDLKALVAEVVVTGPHRVLAVIAARQSGSARPSEVVEAIFGLSGEGTRAVRVVRERAVFADTPIPAPANDAGAESCAPAGYAG